MNTLDPAIESPEDIAEALITASKYIPLDQLGATDDCGMLILYSLQLFTMVDVHSGFSPFSIDQKPKYGNPDFARDIAFKKIANRVQGAQLASAKLGIQCRLGRC